MKGDAMEINTRHATHPSGSSGCDLCGSSRVQAFNWSLAKGDHQEDLKVYRTALHPVRDLRRGKLYACKHCGGHWYLDAKEEIMTHVLPERLGILEAWNAAETRLNGDLLERLKNIGAIPPELYGGAPDFICVPCSVTTQKNEKIDLAKVCFQTGPPIEDWRKKIYFLSEIKDLSDSEYALPADVRIQTARAAEVSMGLAPTMVQAQDGQQFILNGPTDFFVESEYKGRDIRVSDRELDATNLPPRVYEPMEAITYFVGDWFDDLGELKLKG